MDHLRSCTSGRFLCGRRTSPCRPRPFPADIIRVISPRLQVGSPTAARPPARPSARAPPAWHALCTARQGTRRRDAQHPSGRRQTYDERRGGVGGMSAVPFPPTPASQVRAVLQAVQAVLPTFKGLG